MYFEHPKASPLMKEFVRWHQEKFKEWPNYESDHGYFTVVAYKAAVERAAKAAGGKWPSTDQVIQALEGVEVESLSGSRRYREDHIMEATFFQGFTTHKNKHDFVTIDPAGVHGHQADPEAVGRRPLRLDQLLEGVRPGRPCSSEA